MVTSPSSMACRACKQDVQQLLSGLTEDGRISPSVYETARVVSSLPDLPGHAARIDYLLAAQRQDGRWGPRDAGYGLIPTLSAIEALLTVQSTGRGGAQIISTVQSALRGLADVVPGAAIRLPDLPAADLVVAALVPRIDEHLTTVPLAGATQLPTWLRDMGSHHGCRLNALNTRLGAAAKLDDKLLHAAETFVAGLSPGSIQPSTAGSIGASPAATAAWLATKPSGPGATTARRYLAQLAHRTGGPLPCVAPVAVFERAWVLNWLRHTGIPVDVPETIRRSLRGSLTDTGAATAPGLPTDADTTSMVLATLTLLGEPLDPSMLRAYELDTHFCTWPGEQGQSVTTNAHVLEALSLYVRARPAERQRYLPVIRKVSSWLLDQQHDAGHWDDRWHASPYYATFCAALALARFADPPATPAMRSTIRWLLNTQRANGSWGIWHGTPEETAYAVHLLTQLASPRHPRYQVAIGLAKNYLDQTPRSGGQPPLWHDKDLYTPETIVDAALLTTRHCLHSAPNRQRRDH
ncbi:prenyltransferase/squalene oxidase repeat-containing protein [Nocardia sp. NPDC049149]|uniref:prenyltransferase/squalene oxidase repeat-containing protein n=1 Tax=Nocardia sp. NPDC049149 TaxID=3364315 RepID=UPI00371D67D9